MKHLLLLAFCLAVPSLYADNDEGVEVQLFGKTDAEGNKRGLITNRKKFRQRRGRKGADENVEAQLLPRKRNENGDEESLILHRKKLRQHHTFNDAVELEDDEDVETQFLGSTDEDGTRRGLTGRPKLRQHTRRSEKRQRDEEYGDKGQKPDYKRTKRTSRQKYVEETPERKRVVKQTTVKEEGRNWREYLPGKE
jgi:hypothetical protein